MSRRPSGGRVGVANHDDDACQASCQTEEAEDSREGEGKQEVHDPNRTY